MAIKIADASGKSDAKAGDYVVTGGGLYKKTESGSVRVSGLSDFIGKDTTSSYAEVQKAFTNAVGIYGNGNNVPATSSGGGMGKNTTSSGQTGESVVTQETANGLQEAVSIDGYNPNLYAQSYSGTSSAGASKVVGAVILGLVGVAILDRFVSGGKK